MIFAMKNMSINKKHVSNHHRLLIAKANVIKQWIGVFDK